MSIKDDENGKELKQPDYDEDKDQLEEKQEDEIEGLKEETTNQVFYSSLSRPEDRRE
jgi:hypothetical protein